MDHDNANDVDNDFEVDATDSHENIDNDDKAPGEADAPLQDKNLRQVHLLADVVRTDQDYGLGPTVPLPDTSAAALAVFKAMELQASRFLASPQLMWAGGFSEEDPLICFRCLR
jgi:hypothetical protein